MTSDGRVALVTGGGGRLGGAIAGVLADRGMRVAVGYRSNAASASEVAGRLPKATTVRLDVTDPGSVAAAFADVKAELGPVTVLVNAAGITQDRPILRMSTAQWQEVLDTNLSGAFHCAKRALPGMLAARFGRVVSVGSISGALGPAGQANYAAAKAGLVAMTKSLSREMGKQGITANVVAPGLLQSALTAELPPEFWERYRAMTATGQCALVEDVARAVGFCVDCASVTGQVINVDGGIT